MALRRSISLLSALIISLAWAPAARAHPHVWVSMRSQVVFTENGLIKGIGLDWTFDDAYTSMALDGLDSDGDGVYSPAEIAPLTKENIESLKGYEYFTAMRFNDGKQPIGDVTEYGQTWSKDGLALHFIVPLKTPLDPTKGEFSYKIYDPEFFVAIDYVDKDPVAVSGNMPQQCQLVVKPVPTEADLEQTRLMLSTKGTDWKPENNEDFGALFAQPVLIQCQH